MTAYTAVADSEIDPESPGTTTLFTKLRDNPIAITEGSSGAPNIALAALQAGAKPGMHLIETQTASTSASLVFTSSIDSTYDKYIIKISRLIPVNDGTSLNFNVSTDGGSSYLSSAIHDYVLTEIFADSTANNTYAAEGSDRIRPAISIGNDSTGGYSGNIEISNCADSTRHKQLIAQGSCFENTANSYKYSAGMGSIKTATAIDAFKIAFESGNISSGEISLYGIKI